MTIICRLVKSICVHVVDKKFKIVTKYQVIIWIIRSQLTDRDYIKTNVIQLGS